MRDESSVVVNDDKARTALKLVMEYTRDHRL
jgi:hypothetical protein